MKHLDKTILEQQDINWCEPGQSVPMMQGMALNTLVKEYPGKGRIGYFIASEHRLMDEDDVELPNACYYVLERNIEGLGASTVAFKENGDNIEGYAIFK